MLVITAGIAGSSSGSLQSVALVTAEGDNRSKSVGKIVHVQVSHSGQVRASHWREKCGKRVILPITQPS